MRRALAVTALVLVLGAWTCAPVNDGGDPMAGPTTTGLAALVAGEDWHYVGDGTTGLGTTFTSDWENVGTQDLAFRLREAGVVDLMGTIGPTGAWAASVFTLPDGYRPSAATYFTSSGDNITGPVVVSAVLGTVNTDGTVDLSKTSTATVDRVFVQAQIFLTPASAP